MGGSPPPPLDRTHNLWIKRWACGRLGQTPEAKGAQQQNGRSTAAKGKENSSNKADKEQTNRQTNSTHKQQQKSRQTEAKKQTNKQTISTHKQQQKKQTNNRTTSRQTAEKSRPRA